MIFSPNKKPTHQKCPSTFSICLFIFISKGSSDSCPCSAWLPFFSKQCYNDTGLYGLLFLDHSALVFSSEGFIQNVCCHKEHTLTTSYHYVHIGIIFCFGWLSLSHSPYSKYSKYQLPTCSKFREIVYVVVYYELLDVEIYVDIFQNKTSHK